MLKTLSLFLSLFMLFQLQAFANNKDYYSKATATASGQGKVYVTISEPDSAFPDGIFDLYGRKVEHTVPGNLYNSNGRKFIAR